VPEHGTAREVEFAGGKSTTEEAAIVARSRGAAGPWRDRALTVCVCWLLRLARRLSLLRREWSGWPHARLAAALTEWESR
jgi:hypothetical protein